MTKTLILFALLAAIRCPLSALAQGNLTPPGAPAPMMKSLAQIEPRTPVNSLPGDGGTDLYYISQPGSYYLTTNIVVGSGTNGIAVSASDVVIDLNGFTLAGAAGKIAFRSTANLGRVRICNGQLTGWSGGMDFFANGSGTNLTVENVQMTLTSGGSSLFAGIECGDALILSHCAICGASGAGSYAVLAGDRCTFEACTIFGCNIGINAGSSVTVKDCIVKSCPGGEGVLVGSTCILRNNLVDACKHGMTFHSGCVIGENTCSDATGSGFNISGNYNRIEDNVCVGNAYYGFISQGLTTNNLVIRNLARGNGFGNYVLNSTDTVGPIVNTSGTITNLNPWANFSY